MTIKTFINKTFGKIEQKCCQPWLNIIATLYLNFRTLPIKQAIKFPLYVYGRVKFYDLKGNIKINGPIYKGMIKLGKHDDVYSHTTKNIIMLTEGSNIIFNGHCSIANGFLLRITDRGILRFGELTQCGTDVHIICTKYIDIGNYTTISYGCILMDSNCHYTINLNTHQVNRKDGEIILGSKNWIGNNSRILKGAKTGSGCLISSNSIINHNYSEVTNCLLAGSPASIKLNNITRCFSYERENEINDYFKQHPTEKKMQFDKSYTDPLEDMIEFFK